MGAPSTHHKVVESIDAAGIDSNVLCQKANKRPDQKQIHNDHPGGLFCQKASHSIADNGLMPSLRIVRKEKDVSLVIVEAAHGTDPVANVIRLQLSATGRHPRSQMDQQQGQLHILATSRQVCLRSLSSPGNPSILHARDHAGAKPFLSQHMAQQP